MALILDGAADEDLLVGHLLCLWVNLRVQFGDDYSGEWRQVTVVTGNVHESLRDLVEGDNDGPLEVVTLERELGHSPGLHPSIVLVSGEVVMVIIHVVADGCPGEELHKVLDRHEKDSVFLVFTVDLSSRCCRPFL